VLKPAETPHWLSRRLYVQVQHAWVRRRLWCVRQISKQVSTEQEVGGEQQEEKTVGAVAFAGPQCYHTAEHGRARVVRWRSSKGLVRDSFQLQERDALKSYPFQLPSCVGASCTVYLLCRLLALTWVQVSWTLYQPLFKVSWLLAILVLFKNANQAEGWAWWFTSVIPAAQEAEIGGTW
jgi:hypothetical protein